MARVLKKIKNFWRQLGPGLITGAADDDPAGIAIYSIAGAKFGLAALWTALFTLPFIVITQRIAGRIGLISGKGLAGNLKKHYPRWILLLVAVVILAANIINIGADISAMAAASKLLVPAISPIFLAVLISGFITFLLIVSSYQAMVKYLKWVAIVMLSYVLTAFFVQQNWLEILYRMVVPKIILNKDYLMVILAVFGTTISPYLFFWQASEAVEEEKLHSKDNPELAQMIPATKPHMTHHTERIIKNEIGSMYHDVRYGMIFSNLITFFIIALCASTLFRGGITNISTAEELASALKPLAGSYSNFLFLIGVLASGALAVPVLAGSAAYVLAEVFGWRWGYANSFHRAKQFYLVIIIATLLGVAIPLFNLHPVQILFYSGVLYGLTSPLLVAMLIHMANNPKIVGKYTSRPHSNIIAYILFLIMLASSVLMVVL
jgi:NRAMP (natural resistance-associated macrophage protein)-like metal ion transporter